MSSSSHVERRSSFQTVVLGLIVLLACLIRIRNLDCAIRYDEAFTYLEYVSRPFGYPATFYSYPNNHIAHSLLCQVCLSIFGDHAWSLRLPALLAGIGSSVLLGALGFLSGGFGAAVVALLLSAIWPELVEYSTNARGYSLQQLLLLFYFYGTVCQTLRARTVSLIGPICAGALAIYVIPLSVFPLIGITVWALILLGSPGRALKSRDGIRLFGGLSASILLGMLLYLPILCGAGMGAFTHQSMAQPVSSADRVPSLISSLKTLLSSFSGHWGSAPLVLMGVLIVFGATRNSTLRRFYLGAMIGGLISILFFPILGFTTRSRFFLCLIPFLILCVAAAVGALERSIPRLRKSDGVFVFLSCLCASSVLIHPIEAATDDLPDARAIARGLRRWIGPDTRILTLGGAIIPLAYEFEQIGLSRELILGIYELQQTAVQAEIQRIRDLVVVVDKTHYSESAFEPYLSQMAGRGQFPALPRTGDDIAVSNLHHAAIYRFIAGAPYATSPPTTPPQTPDQR